MGEVAFYQISPIQVRAVESHPLALDLGQVRLHHRRPTQHSAFHLSAGHISLVHRAQAEVRVTQVCFREVGHVQVRPRHFRVGHAGGTEIPVADIRVLQIDIAQERAAQVHPSQIGPGQIGPHQLRIGQRSIRKPAFAIKLANGPLGQHRITTGYFADELRLRQLALACQLGIFLDFALLFQIGQQLRFSPSPQ